MWASIKYEHLSDFCYRCGKLGHTSHNCMDEVVKSEVKPGFPLYGPWLCRTRPRVNNKSIHVGGDSRSNNMPMEATKTSLMDIMNGAKETQKMESSRGDSSNRIPSQNQASRPTPTPEGGSSEARSNHASTGTKYREYDHTHRHEDTPPQQVDPTEQRQTLNLLDLNAIPEEGGEEPDRTDP